MNDHESTERTRDVRRAALDYFPATEESKATERRNRLLYGVLIAGCGPYVLAAVVAAVAHRPDVPPLPERFPAVAGGLTAWGVGLTVVAGVAFARGRNMTGAVMALCLTLFQLAIAACAAGAGWFP